MRHVIHRVALTLALASWFTSGSAQGREAPGITWTEVPTQTLSAGGIDFAYRELGKQHGGTPVIFLNHLAAGDPAS